MTLLGSKRETACIWQSSSYLQSNALIMEYYNQQPGRAHNLWIKLSYIKFCHLIISGTQWLPSLGVWGLHANRSCMSLHDCKLYMLSSPIKWPDQPLLPVSSTSDGCFKRGSDYWCFLLIYHLPTTQHSRSLVWDLGHYWCSAQIIWRCERFTDPVLNSKCLHTQQGRPGNIKISVLCEQGHSRQWEGQIFKKWMRERLKWQR